MTMSLHEYDPNGPGVKNGRFMGLPFSEEEAQCILFPVPWEVTTSYGAGTADGPLNILEASYQLDLFDPAFPDTWKKGIFMISPDPDIKNKSNHYRIQAEAVIDHLEAGKDVEAISEKLEKINKATRILNDHIYHITSSILKKNKKILLIGGDHSTPFGYYKALAEIEGNFGILHLDAHCDLRKAYEGFRDSHASIMYNVMENIPEVEKLVQVGIRDLCPAEYQYIARHPQRIRLHHMSEIVRSRYQGKSWVDYCREIIDFLPQKVYLSFDIDVLDPALCPHTGTPVPGGLSYQKAIFLIEEVLRSGRRFIGADLVEVAGRPHEWDGNVGARIAYKIALLLLDS